jgi:hypothetical protein
MKQYIMKKGGSNTGRVVDDAEYVIDGETIYGHSLKDRSTPYGGNLTEQETVKLEQEQD